jgi:hypothetical protein
MRVNPTLEMLAAAVAMQGIRMPNRCNTAGPFATALPNPYANAQADDTAKA